MNNQNVKELKKAEVQTVVECPHCNEPFKVKAESDSFVKACVFCRREFLVVDKKQPDYEKLAA